MGKGNLHNLQRRGSSEMCLLFQEIVNFFNCFSSDEKQGRIVVSDTETKLRPVLKESEFSE